MFGFREPEQHLQDTLSIGTPDQHATSPALCKRAADYLAFKRTLDVCGSTLLLIFLAPLLIVTAAVIWISNPGPVFFRQIRVGRDGAQFECLKFRSMATNADALLAQLLANDPHSRAEWARLHKLTRDPRVTRIGKILRVSSLDELPQLLNVFRGEMSLIGPRPIVPTECYRYGRYINHYYAVRPGLTGLWQVNGRNNTTYRRRIALDVLYIRRLCLGLDARILFKTVPAVLRWDGAY